MTTNQTKPMMVPITEFGLLINFKIKNPKPNNTDAAAHAMPTK